MTRRERVISAINHQQTDRAPYLLHFTPEARSALHAHLGEHETEALLMNDVCDIVPPWWEWRLLADDWQQSDIPTSRAQVRGSGTFDGFFELLQRKRDETDQYLLAVIYGSHFEKAYFARGIENFLADLVADPQFARPFLHEIIERNLLMLELILSAPEIDGVLLGSDWGSQRDLLMSQATWEDMIGNVPKA